LKQGHTSSQTYRKDQPAAVPGLQPYTHPSKPRSLGHTQHCQIATGTSWPGKLWTSRPIPSTTACDNELSPAVMRQHQAPISPASSAHPSGPGPELKHIVNTVRKSSSLCTLSKEGASAKAACSTQAVRWAGTV